jgi:hypothetical protein
MQTIRAQLNATPIARKYQLNRSFLVAPRATRPPSQNL